MRKIKKIIEKIKNKSIKIIKNSHRNIKVKLLIKILEQKKILKQEVL